MKNKNPLEFGGEYPQVSTGKIQSDPKSDANTDPIFDKKLKYLSKLSEEELRGLVREYILHELGVNSAYGRYYYKYTTPYPDTAYKSREEFLRKVKEKSAEDEETPKLRTEEKNYIEATKLISMAKKFDPNQIRMGLKVEKEHDVDGILDTVDNSLDLLKIVLAHLEEDPEYYTKLSDMESEF